MRFEYRWPQAARESSWICPSCHRELPLREATCGCGYLQVFRPTVAGGAIGFSAMRTPAALLFALATGVAALWWLIP